MSTATSQGSQAASSSSAPAKPYNSANLAADAQSMEELIKHPVAKAACKYMHGVLTSEAGHDMSPNDIAESIAKAVAEMLVCYARTAAHPDVRYAFRDEEGTVLANLNGFQIASRYGAGDSFSAKVLRKHFSTQL